MSDAEGQRAFAKEWVDAWNSRDIDRIMAHYHDDVVFRSPVIRALLDQPDGCVRGRAALRAYFNKALRLRPDLRFDLERVYLSVDGVCICYESRGVGAAEVVVLGEDGLIRESIAHYDSERE